MFLHCATGGRCKGFAFRENTFLIGSTLVYFWGVMFEVRVSVHVLGWCGAHS